MKKIKNKTIILRTGFNVPLEKTKGNLKNNRFAKVEDDYRLKRSLETIKELSDNNNKIVIISHIGRKKEESLEPVFLHLQGLLGNKVEIADTDSSESKDGCEKQEITGGDTKEQIFLNECEKKSALTEIDLTENPAEELVEKLPEKNKTLEKLSKKLLENPIKIFFDKKTFLNWENLAPKKKEKKFKKIQEKIAGLKKGEILMLDNIRATSLEKENSKEFAQELVDFGEVYVNDAFSVSHREHTSVSSLARLFSKEKKFLGNLFKKEIKTLEKCFDPELYIKNNFPESAKETKVLVGGKKEHTEEQGEDEVKSIFVLGGAKLPTKAPLLESFLEKYDKIIVGGVLANTIYKALGYEVGNSKVDDIENLKNFDFKKISENPKFFLPNVVAVEGRNGRVSEKEIGHVSKTDKIMDISPTAFWEIDHDLESAKFILFNGPMGYYEGGFDLGTEYLLEKFDNKNNFFVAGGGNTVSLIHELGLSANADFLSTGGGAMIDFLKNKTLPGIKLIKN